MSAPFGPSQCRAEMKFGENQLQYMGYLEKVRVKKIQGCLLNLKFIFLPTPPSSFIFFLQLRKKYAHFLPIGEKISFIWSYKVYTGLGSRSRSEPGVFGFGSWEPEPLGEKNREPEPEPEPEPLKNLPAPQP